MSDPITTNDHYCPIPTNSAGDFLMTKKLEPVTAGGLDDDDSRTWTADLTENPAGGPPDDNDEPGWSEWDSNSNI